jgi:bifunctional non-homologous end joining protein LigD
LCNIETGILFNEHIAEDDPVVFAHACRLGAEGIVSKNSTYRSGRCRVWIKGPQSPEHRRAAGAERDLKPTSQAERALRR